MKRKTLNRLLAENLAAVMAARKISANALGKKAGISPRSLANYLHPEPEFTSKGKERSADLAKLDAIADALGVNPLSLLTDPDAVEEQRRRIAAAVAQAVSGPHDPAASVEADRHPGGARQKHLDAA